MKYLLAINIFLFVSALAFSALADSNASPNTEILDSRPFSAKETVGALDEKSIRLNLLSMDMRPIELCIKDELCEFYVFNANLGTKNKTNYIGDDVHAPVNKSAESFTARIKIKEEDSSDLFEKSMHVINANNPQECIQDKECLWYAFYNLINRTSNHIWMRREGPINYSIFPEEQRNFYPEIDKAFGELRRYFPYSVEKNKVFNSFVFLSPNIEEDVYTNYKTFFHATFENSDLIEQTFKTSMPHPTCLNSVYNNIKNEAILTASFIDIADKYRQNCIAQLIYANAGITTHLVGFPFSFLNKSETSGLLPNGPITKTLTSLDFFIIYLLYQPQFKSGMATEYSTVRKAFDEAYPVSLEKFMKLNAK